MGLPEQDLQVLRETVMGWEIEDTLEQQAEQTRRYQDYLIKESWVKCPRCLAPLQMQLIHSQWKGFCYCEGQTSFYTYEWRNV